MTLCACSTALLVLAGCGGGGGKHHATAHDGAVLDGGATMRDAATATSAGDAGMQPDASTGMQSAIPAPHSKCAALDLAFEPLDPMIGCSPVTCQCDPAPAMPIRYYYDSPVRCATQIRCDVACMMEPYVVSGCLNEFRPCESDADCGGDHCAHAAPGESGECTAGGVADMCFHDQDCDAPGRCVALSADERKCYTGAQYEFCNQPDQCQSSYRCVTSPGSFSGQCSTGDVGSECYVSEDCKSPAQCVGVDPFIAQVGHCSEGKIGDRCAQHSDCDSGKCTLQAVSPRFPQCTDGALGHPCAYASDCASGHCFQVGDGNRCVDGALGSRCGRDADCDTGFCTASGNPEGGTCVADPG